jgi:glycerophosphoryl diester phosphodiesterase
MCGIVGYIGEKPVYDILINGLKKLEYRGYDSSGLMIYNDELLIKKSKGKVSALENLFINEKDKKGNVEKIVSSGLKIYTWTVNNKFDINKVKKLKINGIITDFPERI